MGRKKYDELIPEVIESNDEMPVTAGSNYETQMAENELKVFNEYLRRSDEIRKSNSEFTQELAQTNDRIGRLSHSLETETNGFKRNVKLFEDSMRTLPEVNQNLKKYSDGIEELNRRLKENGNGVVVPFRVQIYWYAVITVSIAFGMWGASRSVMNALGRTWAVISVFVIFALMIIGVIIMCQLAKKR